MKSFILLISLLVSLSVFAKDYKALSNYYIERNSRILYSEDPIAIDDVASTAANTAVTIDVFGNDSGANLSIQDFEQPDNGSVIQSGGSGFLTFTPDEGFIGTTSFTYTIVDSDDNSDMATVTIVVLAAECQLIAYDEGDGIYVFDVQSTPDDFPNYTFSWTIDNEAILEDEQSLSYQFEEGVYEICVEIFSPSAFFFCEQCTLIEVVFDPTPTDTLLVWPGDTNNDGIANNGDLLNIGIAYSFNGIAREVQGINWEAYNASEWDLFTTSINLAYADCNGDSIINDDDVEAIVVNYGETHGKTGGESKATVDDPAIYVDLPEEGINDGDELLAPLMLGDDNLGVDNFYGIAFTIEYDIEILDPNTVEVQLDDSWIGNVEDLLSVQKAFPDQGKIELAITRKNQINVSGGGPFASMIGIIDNIAGKNEDSTEFTVEISNVRAIGYDEQEILLNIIAETAYVEGGTAIQSRTEQWQLYPNPAQEKIFIDGLTETATITITDIQGKEVLATSTNKVIDVSNLNTGIYWIRIQTASDTHIKKIVVE